MEILSHAHRLDTCMYAGAVKQEDKSLRGWREYARAGMLERQGVMTIKQDARLLNREVIRTLVGQSLPEVVAKHGLKANDIDWFLPHYSSAYFREPLLTKLEEIDFAIPAGAMVHQSFHQGQYRFSLFLYYTGGAFFIGSFTQRKPDIGDDP